MSRHVDPIDGADRRGGYWMCSRFPQGPEWWDNLPFDVRFERLAFWAEWYMGLERKDLVCADSEEILVHCRENLARLTMQPSARDDYYPWACSKKDFIRLGLWERMAIVQSGTDTWWSLKRLLEGPRIHVEAAPATIEYMKAQKRAVADFLDSLTFFKLGEIQTMVEMAIPAAVHGHQLDIEGEDR